MLNPLCNPQLEYNNIPKELPKDVKEHLERSRNEHINSQDSKSRDDSKT